MNQWTKKQNFLTELSTRTFKISQTMGSFVIKLFNNLNFRKAAFQRTLLPSVLDNKFRVQQTRIFNVRRSKYNLRTTEVWKGIRKKLPLFVKLLKLLPTPSMILRRGV